MENPYYLIRRSHLPEGMRKTAEVMDLLRTNPELSVSTAVEQVGISRSVFYKYKDVVKPFHSMDQGYILTLSLTLRDSPGVLSKVLNSLSEDNANILTINQSLPLQGLATVIISVDTSHMSFDLDASVARLRNLAGVEGVTLVGQGYRDKA